MEQDTPIERPNTVSGLLAKRKELSRLHQAHLAKAKKLAKDINHLNRAIRLFDPSYTLAMIADGKASRRAPRGHIRRFVLDQFREATEPVTTGSLTALWIETQELSDDENTRLDIRKRLGATINALKRQELIECVGIEAGLNGHQNIKQWMLKEGDN